uniref:Mpv17-like protein n=2 Tax=Pectinophora gossypiella TaxID=13191 RepID=A0A1E1W5Z0_PECGO
MTQSKMARLLAWCKHSLKTRPALSNTVVYASFYTAAELSQQAFNKYYTPEKPEMNYAAAARIVTVGSCVYAPTLTYWYRLLDRKFTGTGLKAVATKVCSDQFLMTPILLAAFYTVLAVLERKEDVFEELRSKYWKTFVANQMFWIPGQTINFFFIPPHLRVVYVSVVSFLWINVLVFIKRQKVDEQIEKVGEQIEMVGEQIEQFVEEL